MEDVINDAFKKSTGSSPEPEATEIEEEDLEETETAKESEEEEGDEDEETRLAREKAEADKEDNLNPEKKEKDGEEKGPIPFERFQEVIQQKQEVTAKLKEFEPIVETHQKIVQYCSANGITQESFSQGLEILALMNSDPQKALEKLEPLVNNLKGVTGDRLPQDLQADVDAGEISLPRAKEIAQLRAQQQFGKVRTEQQQKQQAQRQEQEFQQSLTTAAQSWESSKRGIDPDYMPKKSDKEPDGKWELTKDKFLALLHQQDERGQFANPVRNAQEMTALLERAYLQVNQTFGKLQGNRRPIKALTRNGSSTGSQKSPSEAKTIDEAMRLAAAKHGY